MPSEPRLKGKRLYHRQPVESGIINDPEEYPETSYRAYLGFLKATVILDQFGRADVACRHKAFAILGEKYGLSAARIARLFNVSAMAVVHTYPRSHFRDDLFQNAPKGVKCLRISLD